MLRINSYSRFNTRELLAIQINNEDDVYMAIEKNKILVVEDDPISQRVVQLALEKMGYQVDIAESGSKALDAFLSGNYDLILMDYGLPDMSGVAVTQKIRAYEKHKNKHIPIIALTAHGDSAKTECLAAGMNDFIAKPFELEQLYQKMSMWIEKTQ